MKLVEVEPGEDVVQTLAAHAGSWVEANGHVEGVELRVPTESSDVTRALRGRWTLVTLCGAPPGPLTAALGRSTDSGLELLGGVLVKARSAGVTAALARAERDDVDDERARAPERPRREVPAARDAAPPTTAPVGWAAVAAASDARLDDEPLSGGTGDDDDSTDDVPRPGDRVDHFSFGLCEVLMSDGERLKIRDLKGAGRIREIALSALTVERTKSQGPKRGFRLLRRT